MKKSKNPVLSFFLFVLIVPFLAASTLSRYAPFGMSDRGLLLGAVIVAVIMTAGYYFSYKNKVVKFRIPEGTINFFFLSLVGSFVIISTLMRFDILIIQERYLYIATAVITVVATLIHFIMRKKKREQAQ